MNSNKEHWILCPACGSKTRARLLPDTVSVGSFNSVLKNSGYILMFMMIAPTRIFKIPSSQATHISLFIVFPPYHRFAISRHTSMHCFLDSRRTRSDFLL
ncbi:MAG: cysteine-rich KTR domain-containing protein [Subdoligranulum sp.]